MKSLKIKTTVLFALLSALTLGGCITDTTECGSRGGDTSRITLMLYVPSETGTRSLSSAQQINIDRLDMLAFVEDGSDEKFAYHSTVDLSAFTQDGSLWTGRVTAKMSENNEKYRFVMLANLSSEVASAISSLTTSMTKTQVLEAITFAVTGAWDTATPRYIPMWGETVNTYAITQTTGSIGTIPMVRSVASVEMLFNPSGNSTTGYTAAGFDYFTLEDVKVYNVRNSGYAAPDPANISGNVVSAPTVPVSASAIDISYSGISSRYGSTGDIYITESANTSSGSNIDEDDQTFLVISGYYGVSNTTKKTYYRLDFVSNSTTFLRHDILRNHRYTFLVTSVDGEGYDTEEEAAGSTPINMTVDVLEWNEGAMSDVNFDGQNYLTTTPGEITLSREARTAADTDNKVRIVTDHTDGWEIISIDDGAGNYVNWLSVVTSELTGTDKTISLITSVNATSVSRTAYVNITAGNLTSRVKVTQTPESGYWLSITDLDGTEISELLFDSYAGLTQNDVAAKGFKVNWYPKTISLSVKVDLVGGASTLFPFDTATSGYSSITNGTTVSTETSATTSGMKTYSLIRPVPMTAAEVDETTGNPFLEKGSRVTYTLTDLSTGTVITKTIFIRQTHYNILFDGIEMFYRADGGTYDFSVRSNTSWYISSIVQDSYSGLITNASALLARTGGNNTSAAGETVNFTTLNDVSYSGIVTLYFSNKDGWLIDVPVVINIGYYPSTHGGWAGSNIYYDTVTQKLTFTDVGDTSEAQYYQGIFFQWGSLWGYSPAAGNYYDPDGNLTSTLTTAYLTEYALEAAASRPSGKNMKDRAVLYEVYDPSNGIGDICVHLTKLNGGNIHGKKWRMPVHSELRPISGQSITIASDSDFYYIDGTVSTSRNVYGLSEIKRVLNKPNDIGAPVFPYAGYYNAGTTYVAPGAYSAYWSSSAGSSYTTGCGISLEFNSSIIQAGPNISSNYAFAIRCVVDNDAE